jgi:PAS domain S-box-containing protein
MNQWMKQTTGPFDLKFYSAVFQHLPDPIFIKDRNSRYLLVNKAFCSHYQLHPANIIGHTDRDFLPPELFKASRERERMVLRTGIASKTEQNHAAPDGIQYRVLTLNTLFVTPEGNKLIFGMITDVTNQTQFRQKLRESEKKYKTIFKVIPNPVGIFSYPERIGLDVNTAFAKIGGIPRKNIIGKQGIHGYTWADPEERERYFTAIVRDKKVDNMERSALSWFPPGWLNLTGKPP